MKSLENIISQYEEEFDNYLENLSLKTSRLFGLYSDEIAKYLAKMKPNETLRMPWRNNIGIKSDVYKYNGIFVEKYMDIILRQIKFAWEEAESKNDKWMMELIKASVVKLTGSKLLKIFNRKPAPNKTPHSYTLNNILEAPRRIEALEAWIRFRRTDKIKLSQRIWLIGNGNLELIENYLAEGLNIGRSAQEISQDLRRFLKEPDKRFRRVRDPKTGKLVLSAPAQDYHPGQGVYRSSYKNALRLSRTEINMAYRMADQNRWSENDAILGYEVVLSNSHNVTDICDDLKGKYPKSFIWRTWHPQCRCQALPILPSQDDFVSYLFNDIDLQKQHLKGMPQQMKRYVKTNNEKLQNYASTPYWLEDNFTLKNKQYSPKF